MINLSGRGQSSRMPNDVGRYPRYRFPAAIIGHAVWLYYRFYSKVRDAEVAFERDASGRVTGLVVRVRGLTLRAARVD
jgi:hypothetical protein